MGRLATEHVEELVLHSAVQHLEDGLLLKHYDQLLFEYIFMLAPEEQERRRLVIQQMLVVIRKELDGRRITWERIDEISDGAASLN